MSHYDYLDRVLPQFFEDCEVRGGWEWNGGIIVAHGDKCYGYRDTWENQGIPFAKGVAVYLLTYTHPYGNEVRDTEDGWVDAATWVSVNFHKFDHLLPDILPEDDCYG